MIKKRKRLGSLGVDALLSTKIKTPSTSKQTTHAGGYSQLAIESLKPNRYQPRINMNDDKMKELAESIRQHGIIEPVVVRELIPPSKHYEIIAGERRWRAAQQLGLSEISVVIRQADDKQMAVLALIENIVREDLGALEQAVALHNMNTQFSYTHEEISSMVGCSRANVSNLIRLLELDERVQEMLNADELQMGHARALLRLPKHEQTPAALRVVKHKMSTRQTEKYVESLTQDSKIKPSVSSAYPEVKSLERKLSEHLGSGVKIKHLQSGGGKIIINYANVDVLEGIIDKIV